MASSILLNMFLLVALTKTHLLYEVWQMGSIFFNMFSLAVRAKNHLLYKNSKMTGILFNKFSCLHLCCVEFLRVVPSFLSGSL